MLFKDFRLFYKGYIKQIIIYPTSDSTNKWSK